MDVDRGFSMPQISRWQQYSSLLEAWHSSSHVQALFLLPGPLCSRCSLQGGFGRARSRGCPNDPLTLFSGHGTTPDLQEDVLCGVVASAASLLKQVDESWDGGRTSQPGCKNQKIPESMWVYPKANHSAFDVIIMFPNQTCNFVIITSLQIYLDWSTLGRCSILGKGCWLVPSTYQSWILGGVQSRIWKQNAVVLFVCYIYNIHNPPQKKKKTGVYGIFSNKFRWIQFNFNDSILGRTHSERIPG